MSLWELYNIWSCHLISLGPVWCRSIVNCCPCSINTKHMKVKLISYAYCVCVLMHLMTINYHTVVTSIEFNNTSDLSFCLQWLVAIWSIICRKRAAMWVFWLKKHYRYWNGMAVKMHLSILNTWYRRMNPVYLTEIYKPLSVWDDFRYLFLFIMMLYLFLHHIEFFIGKVLLNY